MIEKIESLLYLPLDIENPPTDFLDHLNNLKYEKLYEDKYRSCYHVPIMYDFEPGNFAWTPYAFPYKSLREWFEDVLFPITGKSRVMIITTPPGVQNPPHIDCSREKFHTTLQHKFRYVLQGNINDLVFMNKHGDVVCNAGPDKPFVMSGSWPHYMTNTADTTKFTLALGAPWDGSLEDQLYVDLITKSYHSYKDYYQGFDELELPADWEELFEDNYNFRQKAKEFISQKDK
jgi:hypothetical protein